MRFMSHCRAVSLSLRVTNGLHRSMWMHSSSSLQAHSADGRSKAAENVSTRATSKCRPSTRHAYEAETRHVCSPIESHAAGTEGACYVSSGKLAEDLLPYLSRQVRELAFANLLLFLSSLQQGREPLHEGLRDAVSRPSGAASVLDQAEQASARPLLHLKQLRQLMHTICMQGAEQDAGKTLCPSNALTRAKQHGGHAGIL